MSLSGQPGREVCMYPMGMIWLSNEGDEYLLCITQKEQRVKSDCGSLTWMHASPSFMLLMFSNGKLSKSSPKMSAFIVFI